MKDTGQVALVDSLECEGSNESSTYTATILSGEDLDRVFLLRVGLLRPVENLTQCLSTTGLEVRVLVEDGAVSADMAGLVALLLADGGNTASREAGSTSADELSRPADELELWPIGLDVQLVKEEVKGLLEVLVRVTVDSCQHVE